MSNNVLIKRSSVQGKVPLTSSLQLGELALNTYDGNLFFKQSPNGVDSIVQVATLGGTQTLSNKTIAGGSSYENENFLVPNSADPYWAYGIFSDGTNVFLQNKFWGGGDSYHGFRLYDTYNNTVPFKVDGLGTTTVKDISITGTFKAGGSNGIAGQFLQSTGSGGLTWGYPQTFGLGNSSIGFTTDANGNPILNITIGGVVVASYGGGQVTTNVPLSMNGNNITGLGAPIGTTDAVTKAYADGATSSGSYPKGDYGGLDAVAAYDAFGVSIVPIIKYDNMTPDGIFLTADFGSSLT